MKNISMLFKNALDDLKRNTVRTFLTSLGILIGVLSVVLLIAFGLGLKNYINEQFEDLGTNLIIIVPGKLVSGKGFNPRSAFGGAQFDEKDVYRLKRIRNAGRVVPFSIKTITAKGEKDSKITEIITTTADVFSVLNLEVDKGKEFTNSDANKRSKLVVLGPKVAEDLFGVGSKVVGKTLRLNTQRYTVIGVLKGKGGGGFGGPDFDSYIYLPYKSAAAIDAKKTFLEIYVQTRKKEEIPDVKAKIEKTLLKRYKEDDFSVIEPTEILQIVSSIFSILNGVLIAIGSISLLVGGIGIMNIMYATVTERIKEIGIRRAVGATKRDILLLFLTESVMLSLFGGVLGLLISTGIVLLIQQYFPVSISFLSVFVAIGVSSIIGTFFGVFPAKKAADLSPIEAIRYE